MYGRLLEKQLNFGHYAFNFIILSASQFNRTKLKKAQKKLIISMKKLIRIY